LLTTQNIGPGASSPTQSAADSWESAVISLLPDKSYLMNDRMKRNGVHGGALFGLLFEGISTIKGNPKECFWVMIGKY
jgi:hypothetical protein